MIEAHGESSKTQRPAPPAAMIRIGETMGLPGVLRTLGVNPADVLAQCGLDSNLFDHPDSLISYNDRCRLIAHSVACTNCAHLGLLVGQASSLNSLGIVGLLAKHSPDVGTALRSLVRYLHLHGGGALPTLSQEGGVTLFGHHICQPDVPAADQVADGALAGMFNMLVELCGPEWKPSEVWFAHRKPEDVEPFRRFFQAFLNFDAEHNAIVFPSSWLLHPLPNADEDLRQLLQARVDALESQRTEDFAGQVRSVLRSALGAGNANAARTAALFGMHPRTLNRRLNASGSGFKELLDGTRFEVARQMLEGSAMSIAAIAAMLDYADTRSFIRAFRRWSGTTPSHWRASLDTRRGDALELRSRVA
jgi:AraC-like DNA-binding protein